MQPTNNNGSREAILSSIRRALVILAPHPGHHAAPPKPEEAAPPPFLNTLPIMGQEQPREWLPAVGESWDEQVQLFAANSVDLRTEFVVCADEEAAHAHLKKLKGDNGWKKIGTHTGDLTDAAATALGLKTMVVEQGYDPHELEKCDAGITQCDALIAQTGSVLVTNDSSGGRVLAILPPHHVVLARRDQMLPDMPAAFELLQEKYGSNYPSLMGFITGPSRTGDIERILVLGAHGPKKMTVLVF